MRSAFWATAPHRAARILTWVTLVLVALTAANFVSELILPTTPAGALEICDTSYQMPDISNASVSTNGVKSEYFGPGGRWAIPLGDVYSDATGGGAGTAFGTGGLQWSTYATSLCQPLDYGISITTLVAGLLLAGLVAVASFMGFLLQIAFTTDVTNNLIEALNLQQLLQTINQRLFSSWGTLLVVVALCVVLYLLLRGAVAKAASSALWIGIAVALVGVAATTTWLSTTAKTINSTTSSLSSSMVTLFNGQNCSDMSAQNAISCMTNNLTNQFVEPVWSAGAAGDQAKTAPFFVTNEKGEGSELGELAGATDEEKGGNGGVKVYWNREGDDADKKDLNGVDLPPTGVVPTSSTNKIPTTADYLRWTQTYTAAEIEAIKEDGKRRCTYTTSPKLDELGDALKDHGDQICLHKWAVRASVMYGMKVSNNGAYGTASGRDDLGSRITPAVLSYPIMGATVLAIELVALLMFVYQIEMVMYLVLVIFYLMGSIVKGPKLMLDWLGWIGATAVKRIGLGLMLGIVLMVFGYLGKITTNISGLVGVASIVFVPLIHQVLLIATCIGLLLMWRKLSKSLLRATKLEQFGENKVTAGMKGAANKVLGIGTAAAAGAVTGGVGAAAMGAGTAALKKGSEANLSGYVRSGMDSGHRLNQAGFVKNMKGQRAHDALMNSQQAGLKGQNALAQAQQAGTEAANQQGEATKFGAEALTAASERTMAETQLAGLQTDHQTAQTDLDDQKVEARNTMHNFVAQHTPEGKQLNSHLAYQRRAAQLAHSDASAKRTAYDQFRVGKGLVGEAHTLDSAGNLQITDLDTGKVRQGDDPSKYDPTRDMSALLSDPKTATEYRQKQTETFKAENDAAQLAGDKKVAEADYEKFLGKQGQKIAGMTNKEIEDKYDPAQADELKTWKRQHQAEAQKQERVKALEQQMQAKEREREAAARREAEAQRNQQRAAQNAQRATDQQSRYQHSAAEHQQSEKHHFTRHEQLQKDVDTTTLFGKRKKGS